MASNVSSSDVGNNTLPTSILLPGNLSVDGMGDSPTSPGILDQAAPHRRKSSMKNSPIRRDSAVKFNRQPLPSVSVTQVDLTDSEATLQLPSSPTVVHSLENLSMSDIPPPKMKEDSEDAELKRIGLKAVRNQRMRDVENLKGKYPKVLSPKTESIPGDDDLDSRLTYNEATVFECFTVYPFSTYCVIRFYNGKGSALDSESTSPRVHASRANELYRELERCWNDWGLLKAITAVYFMNEKLDAYLKEMLSDEEWADLTRTAINYDMKDMSSMLDLVSKGRTDDVAKVAMSVLTENPSRELSGGDVADGTYLSLSNILQLFIDRKDGRSRTLLRLLQHMMDIIKLPAVPTSMYISGKATPTKLKPTSGSYGVVKQMEMGHGGFVAMKRLTTITDVKSLVRESYVWKQLDHINVLPFYGLYAITDDIRGKPSAWDPAEEDMLPAMVSPWMENGDLKNFLKKNPKLSDEDCRKICIGIAKGLLYLHAHKPQIIHGDLKGLNILFDENGLPKLADFGLFRIIDEQATRQMTHKFGSYHMTTKADVLQFGSVMYEVYTGKQPEESNNTIGCIYKCVEKLSPEIWSIISKCCDYNPKKRPDIGAVLHLLYPWKPLPLLSYVLESDQVREGAEGKGSERLMIPK